MKFEEFKEKVLKLAGEEQASLRKIQALITYYFKNKPIPHLEVLQKFVVRCSMNDFGEVFNNVSRCSYNPKPENIKLQRCNYPNQQVFYCSLYSDTDLASSSLTCLVETAWEYIDNSEVGRTYCTFSRWQCNRPLKVWVLPFSNESCKKNRDFEKIRNHMTELLTNLKQYTDDILKALEFISDAFSERNNKKTYYRITSAFFNSLLFYEKFISQDFDGLIYPSANTEGAGLNMVLKKELIDKNVLYCDLATMYTITRLPNDPKHLVIGPASNNANVEEGGKLRFTTIF